MLEQQDRSVQALRSCGRYLASVLQQQNRALTADALQASFTSTLAAATPSIQRFAVRQQEAAHMAPKVRCCLPAGSNALATAGCAALVKSSCRQESRSRTVDPRRGVYVALSQTQELEGRPGRAGKPFLMPLQIQQKLPRLVFECLRRSGATHSDDLHISATRTNGYIRVDHMQCGHHS
ncbi:unnamed protein product [Phytophthora fragariaefolia]|uniref:Unnamed protein product n=1 Tax=Phytophthora fragariaefolia TaxID=1490495 RepID=A0A9W6YDF8_9STRA|nr:unnamed protein product [Phytophthora fragariaefolia]